MADTLLNFQEDQKSSDVVQSNLPSEDPPLVPSTTHNMDDNDVWDTSATKEFRSSFLFQSSCYLPDDVDDATESETSFSHTLPISPLHRHEQYHHQQSSFTSKSSSNDEGLGSVTSILKSSFDSSKTDQPRRVVFLDDITESIDAPNNDNRIDVLAIPMVTSEISITSPQEHEHTNYDDDSSSSSTYRLGGYRIIVPLHQNFHSKPQTPDMHDDTDIVRDTYDPELPKTNNHDEYSRMGVSTLTYNESQHPNHDTILSFFIPKTRRNQTLCIIAVISIVLCLISVAITCGALGCKQRYDPIVAIPNVPSSAQMVAPTGTPSIQPSPVPSMQPTTKPKLTVYSTEELYAYVDQYMMLLYNNSIDMNDIDDTIYDPNNDNDRRMVDVNITEYDVLATTPIGEWDVSQIVNFSFVFDVQRNPTLAEFDEDLTYWDTSNAITMDNMFYGADKFNGNISTWNTSNVVSMKQMFALASQFNGNIAFWDVSKVINMEGMFRRASNFNGNLKGWNTSSVTTMSKMFHNCLAFTGAGIDRWDTSNVIDMTFMFRHTPSFNGDLSVWDVSKVTNMRAMFRQAIAFNGDLSNWDLSNVIDISEMFMHALRFNADTSGWNTSSVMNASKAFFGAISFSGDVTSWDVRNLKDLTQMFAGAINFDSNLCPWYSILPNSSIQKRRSIFVATRCPFPSNAEFIASNVTLFCHQCQLPTANDLPPTGSSHNIFAERSGAHIATQKELFNAVDEYLLNTTNVSFVALKYGHPIGSWNVSLVTNFSNVFDSTRNPNTSLFSEDLIGWDTSRARSMSRMFAGASRFNGNISTWTTDNVITMEAMFLDAYSFTGDISNWNTARCVSMASMFLGADLFNGNLSSFDTTNVVDMSAMFWSAISFEGIGLHNWNTSSVTSMNAMFSETFSFRANVLSGWDVSNVVDMAEIFQYSTFNGNVEDWNVRSVEFFQYAFSGAGSFNHDLSPWNVSSVKLFIGMFVGAKGFNQNLCDWGPLIDDRAGVVVTGMFVSSACLNTNDPNIGGNKPIESLCKDCTY